MRHTLLSAIISPASLAVALVLLPLFLSSAGAVELTPIPVDTIDALEYHKVSNWFWGIHQVVGLLLPLVLLFSGWGAMLYSRIFLFVRNRRSVGVALFAGTYFVMDRLVRTPVGFLWERAHGRATGGDGQAFLPWLGSQVASWLLPLVGVSIGSVIAYWLISKSPRHWGIWAFAAGSVAVFTVLLAEPWTQRYRQLGGTRLETSIVELAGRVGIPKKSIVVEHCDPADSCPPGRVIGLGPTRLMLLNDALLAKNPERWTLQMVAHEAKHFALDDNVKALFLLSGLLLVGLWLVNRVVGDCTHRWPVRFGFSQLGDPASLPLVVFVLMAAFLVLLPAINAFRQHVELEADRFALEFNRDNRAQAEMIASWAADSKLQVEEVSLFSQLFRASHPSGAQRIRLANGYHPWLDGQPLVYGNILEPQARSK
jgi:STE24 endopeptidase